MNIEKIRDYCLSKKSVTEGFPFGDQTLVFKVSGKMFATLSLSGESRMNLKCNPERAIELREYHHYVIPGYHMNKKHWNTVLYEFASEDEMKEWINHSYELVYNSLHEKKK